MTLTKKQEEGLRIALERYKNNKKYVTIAGYAGSGKSTLVRFIIEALDVEESKVAYAAFTGKAAEVLRKKGNQNAMTLHRLLYDSIPRPGGGFFRKPKVQLDYTIVVIDEISMLPKSMLTMLLRHKVFCIFLGDPFQLPQIDKDEKHGLLEHPHVFLDEVMRQAAESEIIRATMKIRDMETLPFQKGQEMQILSISDLVDGCYLWADQIITGTNITRRKINDCVRRLKGFNGNPQEGEKIICLQNYWETLSDNGDALVNGTTGILHNPQEFIQDIPYYIPSEKHEVEVILGNFKTEDGCDFWVDMDKEMITTGEFSLDWRATYQLGKRKAQLGDIVPKKFDYGYAITAWKAQGSEWDNVVVIEEKFPFDKLEHAKFLYTACTRASKKLVLVKN